MTHLDYPLIALTDLHGQLAEFKALVSRLEKEPVWDQCALVFLGDYVDRNPGVKETIDLVLKLLKRPAGGVALMGNHDLALVRAAGLDDREPSPYWVNRYFGDYNNSGTFKSYLGRPSDSANSWPDELDLLRKTMSVEHRKFLGSLPWVAEAPGHLFLHCGLSPELEASPQQQVAALHSRSWHKSSLKPRPGTKTHDCWTDDYPVWLGADPGLSEYPLAYPGKVQVTGHRPVQKHHVNPIRIRLDTSGGSGILTAAILMSARSEPTFITSR
jgi:serine/threonine protein phosphatase 1